MRELTKAQNKLLNLLRSNPNYYITYDSIMAKARLWENDNKNKTIPFRIFLGIRNHLTNASEQTYSTITKLILK